MRRVLSVVLTAVLLLSLTGCSFINLDMEAQLRSPYAAGEQTAIQEALEKYIYEQHTEDLTDDTAVSYILKYPKMGEYRSAFIMKDITGDGKEDALAFYAMQPEGANTHIALLCKKDGVWQCVDDIEGLATEIERIQFGDLDGNGRPELFAGFAMYNTRDRRLMLYTWSGDHFVERYSDTYTNMIVGSVCENGKDDLLLFRLNSAEEKTTVRLLSMVDDGTIAEQGNASLDGHILRFGDYTITSIDSDVRGIYQDCIKDSYTTITELIVWDGEQLTAPLYDPAENITTLSARESMLPSMDIDNDGEIEWPQSFRMTGDELTKTEDMVLWQNDWYTWDQQTMAPVKKMTNIVNVTDGYYLIVPDEWNGTITAQYDKDTRCMSVSRVVNGVVEGELFNIVAYASDKENPLKNGEYLFLASYDNTRYEVQYDKFYDDSLSMQRISSLFVLCDMD